MEHIPEADMFAAQLLHTHTHTHTHAHTHTHTHSHSHTHTHTHTHTCTHAQALVPGSCLLLRSGLKTPRRPLKPPLRTPLLRYGTNQQQACFCCLTQQWKFRCQGLTQQLKRVCCNTPSVEAQQSNCLSQGSTQQRECAPTHVSSLPLIILLCGYSSLLCSLLPGSALRH